MLILQFIFSKSIKEKEDEEVKMMKQHKFKAKPVPKAINKAPAKVPMPHKPPTGKLITIPLTSLVGTEG